MSIFIKSNWYSGNTRHYVLGEWRNNCICSQILITYRFIKLLLFINSAKGTLCYKKLPHVPPSS